MSNSIIVAALIIAFVAGFTRATFGFGDALLSMPLLTFIAGPQTATPFVALIALVITIRILWQDWRQVEIQAAWQLILASLLGIPFGLWLLTAAPEAIVTTILGITIILFSLYRLFQPQLIQLGSGHWAYLFGFAAGVLGGAYNTNGPPVIIYSALRQWPPDRFRATLQGYFLPTGFLILIGHALSGLWTPPILQLFATSIPLILIGVFLGDKVNKRITPKQFERVIYLILIVLGILLLI